MVAFTGDIIDSVKDGLSAVSSKQVIAYVGTLSAVAYSMQSKSFLNVKIAGTCKSNVKLSVLINKNSPQLVSILDKTIDNISEKEKIEILSRWVKVTYEKGIDCRLVWQLMVGFFILLTIIFIVYMKQKRLHNKIQILNDSLEQRVKEESEKNRQQQLMMFQKLRLAQMGEIISMIAHQWRQPLNNLALVNQLLLMKYSSGKLDDNAVAYFSKNSQKQIGQMSTTIDDFRNFFKPEKEKKEFCVNDIIDKISNIVKPIYTINGIKINLNMPKSHYTIGYPNGLGQAILNIINNAQDALIENKTGDRQINIAIEQEGEYVHIRISDNASGIPENIVDKIFDPYFSTKEDKNGTGLGLYMTKMIIEDHMNAKISVANSDDGAVFSIYLKRE